MSAPAAGRVAAVVVDYQAADVLPGCVESLLDEGVAEVVVVENGAPDPARRALAGAGLTVSLLVTGRNLGYGAGANRGLAAVGATGPDGGAATDDGDDSSPEMVLVCNPDLRLHPGAVAALVTALDDQPAWAVVGPRILTPDGAVYPSVRAFPSMVDAAGHALVALFNPDNRFSSRYRPMDGGGNEMVEADWVSGACFLARRSALEELGGFDESYFMFAEDMDLCWRARQAGWGVGVQPAAVVTHLEGVSRRVHPYRMVLAHHRSALRFANRTTRGWRRLALPAAAAVLGLRLVVAYADAAFRR
jgi:N-acetylglucosaminyl-diphospho-decaprenol L-rhamnosyltransferase